jgi:hypothetical protein
MLNWRWEKEPQARPWWLEVAISFCCVVTAVLIIASLAGCATSRDAEVCYMKPIGLTEQGFTVAFQQCMTPEAFQESQK